MTVSPPKSDPNLLGLHFAVVLDCSGQATDFSGAALAVARMWFSVAEPLPPAEPVSSAPNYAYRLGDSVPAC